MSDIIGYTTKKENSNTLEAKEDRFIISRTISYTVSLSSVGGRYI